MRTIALFLPNWIGDVVMATPAIRAVRDHFPQARLLAVSKPYVADTVAGSPWFDDLIPFDKSGPRHRRFRFVLNRLADEKLDAAVLFPNSFRPALLARLAGSRYIVGYARYFRDALLTRRLYATRGNDGRPKPTPVLDDYNRLVEQLGVPNPGRRMELFTTPADEQAAETFWLRHGLNRVNRVIGLNPGGAFGASKHWPTNQFAEVAKRFADQRSTAVVVLCGPAEREEANRIAEQSGRANVISLAGSDLSIGLTKAVVRRLSLLVTTDSGPRHFAAAFGVPVVSLFGPTHIAWTETHFAKAVHLQNKLPCGPCQQRICPLGHHQCMTSLSETDVFAASQELLARFPAGQEARRVG
ncbi:lipopolysaccharide heptosyltransferase II [Limnoglobus roseus]|uniref:lipopolysaccharide heptosyltransferase II n=1 Tax=Limnoglobus roseus TaxID=2598579 RepID=A0A5C1A5U4_9BACT|nr:lipopolysaccharide heptosyltransferase II [Limnoglobus roseus]QEL14549.1 GT9 family glycosyltransferase [Limnoglobus roseus]